MIDMNFSASLVFFSTTKCFIATAAKMAKKIMNMQQPKFLLKNNMEHAIVESYMRYLAGLLIFLSNRFVKIEKLKLKK